MSELGSPRSDDIAVPPPVRIRLNPKLTGRRPYPSEPPPIQINIEESRHQFLKEVGALKLDSARSDDEGKENPKAGLLHIGQWIPTEYNMGRPIKFTGMWSCCGHPEKHSLYCDSLEAREVIIQAQDMARMLRMSEAQYKNDSKVENVPTNYELKLDAGETAEDKAMREINSQASGYNAPMLLSWLLKHIREEQTILTGMELVKNHVQTGDGCQLMHTHGAVEFIQRASAHYKQGENHFSIQLSCVLILRQLLDCNYTRDEIISRNTNVLRLVFSIGHRYMTSKDHVENVVQCIMQCSRAEVCRMDILDRKLHIYLTIFCKSFSHNAKILRAVLKTFNWLTTTTERIIALCHDKAIVTVINCMKRHMSNADVLAPGMLFLTRASSAYPLAMETVLKMKAVGIIIGALKALFNNEVLQLEGLKMIQQLSKTSEGWKQIQETRGGWQTICQGTTLGNALLHDVQGSFHNPGWCIGDTHYMPFMERSMQEAQKVLELRNNTHEVSSYWNPNSLQEYMGISGGKKMTLSINTNSTEAYFQLVKTLDLLPTIGEEREYWFMRLKEYEVQNEIKIDDMVATILSMKQKEVARLKELEKNKHLHTGEDYVKPIYVMGDRVTTQLLDAKDIAVEEQLSGILET